MPGTQLVARLLWLPLAAGLATVACAVDLEVGRFRSMVQVAVSPSEVAVQAGGSATFTATVTGAGAQTGVTWSVQEEGGGRIDAAGSYTAPSTLGTYHVVATSAADPSQSGSATVKVERAKLWVAGGYEAWQRELYPPTLVDFGAMTHLVVRSWQVSADGSVAYGGYLDRALALDLASRAHASRVQVLMSLEPFAGASAGALGASTRPTLVAGILSALTDLGYDGVEISGPGAASLDDYVALAHDLRVARPEVVIATSLPWDGWMADVAARMAPSVDLMTVETWEMALVRSEWLSWHCAALDGAGEDHPGSVARSVSLYTRGGVPVSKLGVGVRFAGQAWTAPVTGPLQAIGNAAIAAVPTYPEIMRDYYGASGVVRGFSDDASGAGVHAQVPWLQFPAGHTPAGGSAPVTWVSYEDARSIAAKGAWAREHGLGGVGILRLAEGVTDPATGANPLLEAIKGAFLE